MSFYSTFSRVSTAVQQCLRNWLPYVYFSDLDRYDNLETAYSVLVYQAGKPFKRKARADFTYDAMNPASVALAFRHAGGRLPDILRTVQRLLLASGRTRTAESYSPGQFRRIINSVKRGHRHFGSLLAADAFFMHELVKLGHRGGRLREDLRQSPREATKRLSRFTGDFLKAFHGKLRRLPGGQEFLAFGSLLLVEATSALSAALGTLAPIEAVMRLRAPGEASAGEHVFVNDAFRAGRSAAPGRR